MGRIKSFLKNFILTKFLYHKIAAARYQRKKKKKLRAMKAKGNETIFLIQSVLEGKCFFFFDMGTLLGMIREGRLLGHDLDIDVAVYVNSQTEICHIRKVLNESGCCLKYSYLIDTIGIVEDSYEVNGIKFDINYYAREGDKDVCYLMYRDAQMNYEHDQMDVVKLTCSPILETTGYCFLGREVNVPVEAEKYLAERYGSDWRIPNTAWIYWKGPSTHPTDFVGKQNVI